MNDLERYFSCWISLTLFWKTAATLPMGSKYHPGFLLALAFSISGYKTNFNTLGFLLGISENHAQRILREARDAMKHPQIRKLWEIV